MPNISFESVIVIAAVTLVLSFVGGFCLFIGVFFVSAQGWLDVFSGFLKFGNVPVNDDNLRKWKGWWKYILTDQFIIWIPGCVMGMALLALLSIESVRWPVKSDQLTQLHKTEAESPELIIVFQLAKLKIEDSLNGIAFLVENKFVVHNQPC